MLEIISLPAPRGISFAAQRFLPTRSPKISSHGRVKSENLSIHIQLHHGNRIRAWTEKYPQTPDHACCQKHLARPASPLYLQSQRRTVPAQARQPRGGKLTCECGKEFFVDTAETTVAHYDQLVTRTRLRNNRGNQFIYITGHGSRL